MIRIITKI